MLESDINQVTSPCIISKWFLSLSLSIYIYVRGCVFIYVKAHFVVICTWTWKLESISRHLISNDYKLRWDKIYGLLLIIIIIIMTGMFRSAYVHFDYSPS